MGTYSDLFRTRSVQAASQEENVALRSDDFQEERKEGAVESAERFSERKTERSEANTLPFPLRRETKRYSFEFFDDQILAIKRLVYEANLAGETISQSDIVRAALDQYFKKEK